MQLREPTLHCVDIAGGHLGGASGRYVKTLPELAGLYEDGAAYDSALAAHGDTAVYEVSDFRPSDMAGDLIFGVTRMLPGRIGREYFLTRGHIHANANRPEIYIGESGAGVMLLESPDGEIRALPIGPKTICYVPPYWIHRSVNVGASELVMSFAYPADSGQDYAIIERSGGMRSRVVDDGRGGWKLADNLAYKPRPRPVIDSMFEAG